MQTQKREKFHQIAGINKHDPFCTRYGTVYVFGVSLNENNSTEI